MRGFRRLRREFVGEGALGVEFKFELSGEVLAFELSVFTDIAGDHFLDLSSLEEDAEAEIVDTAIVADYGNVLDS